MELTQQEHYRLDELETEARDSFIENSDYLVSDYLDDEKAKEWEILFDKFLKPDLDNE